MSSLVGQRVITRNLGHKGTITMHDDNSEVVCVKYDEPIAETSSGKIFHVAMRFYRLEEVKFV